MIISKHTPKVDIEKGAGCKRCGHCCHFSSGIVLTEEIPQIAQGMNMSEEGFKQKYLEPFEKFNTKQQRFKQLRVGKAPHGRCIFLDTDENLCTIHEIRPLHCRVSTCEPHGEDVQQWFDVNYFLNAKDDQSVREYALYLKLKDPLPGGELEKLFSDKKLKQILNYGGMQNGGKIIFD